MYQNNYSLHTRPLSWFCNFSFSRLKHWVRVEAGPHMSCYVILLDLPNPLRAWIRGSKRGNRDVWNNFKDGFLFKRPKRFKAEWCHKPYIWPKKSAIQFGQGEPDCHSRIWATSLPQPWSLSPGSWRVRPFGFNGNFGRTAGAEATAATMRCKQQLTLCYESSPIRTARCHGQLCKQISRQSSMEQCMLEWVGAGMAVKAAACAAEIDGLGPAIPTSSPLAVGSFMCLWAILEVPLSFFSEFAGCSSVSVPTVPQEMALWSGRGVQPWFHFLGPAHYSTWRPQILLVAANQAEQLCPRHVQATCEFGIVLQTSSGVVWMARSHTAPSSTWIPWSASKTIHVGNHGTQLTCACKFHLKILYYTCVRKFHFPYVHREFFAHAETCARRPCLLLTSQFPRAVGGIVCSFGVLGCQGFGVSGTNVSVLCTCTHHRFCSQVRVIKVSGWGCSQRIVCCVES